MKDIKISSDDLGMLCVCAIRYCQGRQTYMPSLIRPIVARYLQDFDDNEIIIMINDCKYQEDLKLYGDEKIDKPGWILWKQLLINEMNRRAE